VTQAEFFEIMDAWAEREAEIARTAATEGDERERSIALMKESMYRTMLRTIAVKAPARLKTTAEEMAARAEKFTAAGDIDAADRCIIQKGCIERVMKLMADNGGIA